MLTLSLETCYRRFLKIAQNQFQKRLLHSGSQLKSYLADKSLHILMFFATGKKSFFHNIWEKLGHLLTLWRNGAFSMKYNRGLNLSYKVYVEVFTNF